MVGPPEAPPPPVLGSKKKPGLNRVKVEGSGVHREKKVSV